MKRKLGVWLLVGVALLAAVPAGWAAKKNLLWQIREQVLKDLLRLDAELERTARALSATGLEGAGATAALAAACATNALVVDVVTINTQGVVVAVQPDSFKDAVGRDIGAQPHIARLLQDRKPVLGKLFGAVEGAPRVVALARPVWDAQSNFIGAVSLLFEPAKLVAGALAQYPESKRYQCYVYQTDGVILYNVDTAQVGRSAFMDWRFKQFPKMGTVVRQVIREPRGQAGPYEYMGSETKYKSWRMNYWTSINLHDSAWRVGYTQEVTPIMPVAE